MKKRWKKILAAGCAAAMLMTMHGICVLADELQEEEIFVTEAEIPEEIVDFGDSPDEDVTDDADLLITEENIYEEDSEEAVGKAIQVGDGVTATYDANIGAVEFTSQNGELWPDWIQKLGVPHYMIRSIKVVSGTVYLPADSSGYDSEHYYRMFGSLEELRYFDSSGFNTSNVTDMSKMFCGCWELRDLDLSSFDTSDVTDMSGMFAGCEKLQNLDLSSFDTSNVTDMSGMFHSCYVLNTLDLSNFDTSNVTNMANMFSYCSASALDLSSFDTSNVTNMSGMFEYCNIRNRNISVLNTSNVTNMSDMFSGASIGTLDLSNFDTSNVTNMGGMFYECYGLKYLDLSSFDTSNVTNMGSMFGMCESLKTLDLSSFDTSKVTNMTAMFSDCKNMINLNLSNFDISNVTSMGYMFRGCSALQLLNTPKKNELPIAFSNTMYDESGNAYEELPVLTMSIILTSEKQTTPASILDISDYEIILSSSDYIYNGKAKKPSVTVKSDSTILNSGTDYTVSYINNTNAGTAMVKVNGIGNYEGENSVTFKINKAYAKLAFAERAITKKITDTAFTNTLTKTTDGTVTFASSDSTVATVDSESGLVTIKDAGTAIITATASEGQNYIAGSATFALTIEAQTPTPTPAPAVNGFSDVQDPTHPYYNAIYWAAGEGITKGYSDGTFGINRSCTRGEMMMFLWRFARKPAPKAASKSPFKDVPKTHTFYKPILWGYQQGITKGYSDGTFGINRNVSRGEAMMFLWKLKGKPAPKAVSKSPFKDVPTTHAFYKAILWGSQKGITKGYTSGPNKGKFGINDNCTRGQIVTFLYRAK